MTLDPNFDKNAPGVRRYNYSVVDPYSPEHLAHERDVSERNSRERGRLARRRDVPPFRKTPPKGTEPIRTLSAEMAFVQKQNQEFMLSLGRIEMHPSGLKFDLIAREDDEQPTMIGSRINLTHRLTAHPHRVYLGVVLEDGSVVTNKKATPPQAPEDDDVSTPWLYAGTSYSSQTETGATYFLSPPPSGTLTFTISYPELRIDQPATLLLDIDSLQLHPNPGSTH